MGAALEIEASGQDEQSAVEYLSRIFVSEIGESDFGSPKTDFGTLKELHKCRSYTVAPGGSAPPAVGRNSGRSRRATPIRSSAIP